MFEQQLMVLALALAAPAIAQDHAPIDCVASNSTSDVASLLVDEGLYPTVNLEWPEGVNDELVALVRRCVIASRLKGEKARHYAAANIRHLLQEELLQRLMVIGVDTKQVAGLVGTVNIDAGLADAAYIKEAERQFDALEDDIVGIAEEMALKEGVREDAVFRLLHAYFINRLLRKRSIDLLAGP